MSESGSGSDSDSMMRSMMGFSSFGSQLRTSKKASDAPVSTGSNAAPVAKKARTGTAQETIAKAMRQPEIIPSSASVTQAKPEPRISQLLPTTTTTAVTTTPADSAPGATKATTTTFQSTTSPPAPSYLPEPAPTPPFPLAPSSITYTHTNTNTHTSSSIHPTHSTIGYTSPTNPSYKLTPSECSALRSGRRNARGDTVYFKPGFIDEDPWKALRPTTKSRAV